MAYTKDPTVDSWDTAKQLDYFKANPFTAQQEIARAQGIGGTAATDWANQLQGFTNYSGPASVAGTSYSDDPKSYQNIATSALAKNPGQTQFNGWTDKATGNVYDTTNMTPQQVYALGLSKEGNKDAAKILQGMGLDINGNPTSGSGPTFTTSGGSSSGTGTGGSFQTPATLNGGSSGSTGGTTTGGAVQPNAASNTRIQQMLDAIYGQKPTQQTYTAPDFKPGQQVDLKSLFDTINANKPTSTFSLSDLQNLMNTQNGKAGAAQYQTPQDIANLVTQMNTATQPLANAQKASANTSYNSSMQNLKDQWASRGMLASGGAAAKEQEGANALAQQMSGIDAQQQANSIPLAFQAANLGLQSQQQAFNQGQQGVNNMQSALGIQNGMQQNYLNNLQGATAMNVNQNQWAQNFGQAGQQQNYNQWLGQQQLNQNANNQWTNNVLQGTAQATGNDQFNTNLAQRQADQAQQNNQFQQQLSNSSNQFNQTLANQQAQQQVAANQWQQTFGQNQSQSNISNALNLSQLMGQLYQPKSGGAELFNQNPLGATAATQNTSLQAILNAANNYPQMPGGTGTAIGGLGGNFSDLASFFNSLQGKTTNTGINSNIAQQNANTSAYNASNSAKGVSGSQNTQGVMAEILQAATYDDPNMNRTRSMQWLQEHATEIAQSGANIDQIKNFINQTWPDSTKTDTANSKTATSLNKAADSYLSKMDPDYPTATPEQKAQKIADQVKLWNGQ